MTRMTKTILVFAVMLTGANSLSAQDAGSANEPVAENFGERGGDNIGNFSSWDFNKDNRLDHGEFSAAMESHFSRWDADGDEQIDRGEWKKNVSQNYGFREYDSAYGEWDTDADNSLSNREFIRGMVNVFDEDENGYIDNDEYRYWTWEDEKN